MRQALAVVTAVLVLGAAVGGAYWWLEQQTPGAGVAREVPEDTADAYLEAWSDGDHEAMLALVRDPPDTFVAAHEQLLEGLGVDGIEVTRHDIVEEIDGRAHATGVVTSEVPDVGEVTWEVEVRLLRERGRWGVAWEPSTLHPSWRPGLRFDVVHEDLDRIPILAHDGTQLAGPGERITFGFDPGGIEDRDEVIDAFEAAIPGSGTTAERLLGQGGLVDGWFYPVTSVSADDAREAGPSLTRVPGVLRRAETSRRSLLADGFALHAVGRVDEATAEQLEQLGDPYERGDHVGQFGLEATLEARLAGGEVVTAVLREGSNGPVRATLGSRGSTFSGDEAVDTDPLTTTLDVTVQRAVENALVGRDSPAAIVVVDGEDGAIRATASRPLTAYNRAFEGRYPPGSTFKLVTAEALLADGVTLESDVACPAETFVGGLRVPNAGGRDLGTTTFTEAFAASCNTTFAPLGADLGTDAMVAAAERFGFGVDPRTPIAAFGGSFPTPGDRAELGAASFGQARVEVSPLHLASVVAATVTGTWHVPYLLEEDGPGEARVLSSGSLDGLRRLLEASVPAIVDEPGLLGKTGTAQDGQAQVEHAWFVGTVDGLGFAVLLEGGGSGEQAAAPLAARFARELRALQDTPADVSD